MIKPKSKIVKQSKRAPSSRPDNYLLKIEEQFRQSISKERKSWNKPTVISPHDYDFSKLKKEERCIAWLHELDRELGLEKEAWQSLSERVRANTIKNFENVAKGLRTLETVYELHLGNEVRNVNVADSCLVQYPKSRRRAYLLEFDWTNTDTQIVLAFKSWLSDKRRTLAAQDPIYRDPREVRGNQHDYKAWLRQLGMFRLSKQMNRFQAGTKLQVPEIRKQRWSDAIKRTEERVLERIETLVFEDITNLLENQRRTSAE